MSKLTGEDYVLSSQKRAFDIIGGTLALGSLGIPMGVLAAASAIDTRTNPIMRQKRSGQGGSTFNVLKTRTVREPQSELPDIIRRYSNFGRILRKSGLDEAPQLINVVKGEMSLVGPRPILDTDLERREGLDPALFNDWYHWYRLGRPGLTGPAQLYIHHRANPEDKDFVEGMKRDVQYLEKASLKGDLAILAKTALKPLIIEPQVARVIDLTEDAVAISIADLDSSKSSVTN